MLSSMMQSGMHHLGHAAPFGVHLLVSTPTISHCTEQACPVEQAQMQALTPNARAEMLSSMWHV